MRQIILSLLLCSVSFTHAAPAELDWLELMPAEDRKALEEMPEIEHNSPEADGFSDQGGLKQGSGLPEVMYSARTVPSLSGRRSVSAATPFRWKPIAKAAAPSSFWCPIRAPVSTFHRHRRTRS